MKTFDKRVTIIYSILATYLLITSFFISNLTKYYSIYINPIFWLILAFITFMVFGVNEIRYKSLKDKIQIVLIIMLCYIILYFLSGLLFDFAKNIYSTKIDSMLKNIWAYALILIFKEFVREKMLYYSGKKMVYAFLVTGLFIVSDIELFSIDYYFTSSELFFKYFFSTIFPIISLNIVATYLVCVGGFKTSLIFRMPLILIKLLIPIQPNLDWFILGLYEGILPVVVYLVINKYHLERINQKSRKEIKGSNPVYKIILLGMLVVFGLFVGGIFKFTPVAVMSGSMEPIFYRGDVVVVEKVEENYHKLKLYDIIEYRLDDRIVLHRIVKIEDKEGKLTFITKGDNNELEDEKPVETSQIVGKVKFVVKYIGYPSVLLNEYFSK